MLFQNISTAFYGVSKQVVFGCLKMAGANGYQKNRQSETLKQSTLDRIRKPQVYTHATAILPMSYKYSCTLIDGVCSCCWSRFIRHCYCSSCRCVPDGLAPRGTVPQLRFSTTTHTMQENNFRIQTRYIRLRYKIEVQSTYIPGVPFVVSR